MTFPRSVWGWCGYYALDIARRAGRAPKDEQAWMDGVVARMISTHSELAERWWSMFQVDERGLARALVDGTAPRWTPRRRQ